MHTYRPSFGYLSSLVVIGALTTLVGCGGDGNTAAGSANPADPSEAGQANAGTGGSTANGTGGSASAGKSGSAAGGSGGSDSAGSSNAGSSNAGSSNAGSSNAGSSGSAGGSNASGGSGASDDGMDGDYSPDDFNHAEPTGPDHPLTHVESKLMRRDEVSLVGTGASNLFGRLLDDASKGYATIAGNGGASFLADMRIVDTAYSNLDDDGNDELVAVGFVGTKLVVRIIDSDANGVLNGVKEFAIDDATYKHAWVRIDDFDQDGRDEILVAAVSDSGVVARVYDDALGNFALLKQVYQGPGQDISIASGNFDKDRSPELALLVQNGDDLTLSILDDQGTDYASRKQLKNAETGLYRFAAGLKTSGVRIEAGNFDQDAEDEIIAFADGYDPANANGGESSGEGIFTTSLDDAAHDFAPLGAINHDFPRSMESSGYHYNDVWPWQTLIADTNGDGTDELLLLTQRTSENGGREWVLWHDAFGADAKTWSSVNQVLPVSGDTYYRAPATMTRATGRTDSRGADVIIAVHDQLSVQTYRASAMIAGASYEEEVTALGSATSYTPENQPVWATAGDWNGDSLRVRFTGEKWLELTRPRPIVLMAAPPTKDGIDQEYDSTGTSYTTESSNSNEQSEEIGYTDTVTISLEASVPFADFISASVTAEFSKEFTETNTKTTTTTTSKGYVGSYGEDAVVFAGTLCERSKYVILGGSDPKYINTEMTIDVPIDAGIYEWSIEDYDAALGAAGATPLTGVFGHTVGDPSTYLEEANTPADKLWQSDGMKVGHVAGGHTFESISVAEESSTGATSSTTYSAGGEGGAFLHVGYSHGWNSSSSYSVTIGHTTTFEGDVGNIGGDDDYTDWNYTYGMVVYPKTLTSGESFQVVDYWTNPTGKAYPPKP